jgi:hypothetical protein
MISDIYPFSKRPDLVQLQNRTFCDPDTEQLIPGAPDVPIRITLGTDFIIQKIQEYKSSEEVEKTTRLDATVPEFKSTIVL